MDVQTIAVFFVTGVLERDGIGENGKIVDWIPWEGRKIGRQDKRGWKEYKLPRQQEI